MLTLPDFEQKKIVFISSRGDLPNDLKFGNSNIRLYRDDKFIDQISCYQVISLFILGSTTITSSLIKNANEFGISIFLLNDSLFPYAEINSKAEGNTRIREIQYKSDEKSDFEIAKKIVLNKIFNQGVLQKKKEEDKKKQVSECIQKALNIKSLLGYEGNFAKEYFAEVFSKIGWYRRAPRTKEDIPNLLLDIGYTYLLNYVDSILRLFGFDTYRGFYHQLFFQRKSLSCDVMEPMRPIVDKQLVKSYNLKQINEKDFNFKNGSFSLKYAQSRKYSGIFFDLIMDYRVEIYSYVLGFYRFLLNPEKYRFPVFQLKCT